MSPLDKVILAVAGGSPGAFAKMLGERPQTINNWRTRGVPANKCLRVVALAEEKAPGLITAADLRADVFGAPSVSSAQ